MNWIFIIEIHPIELVFIVAVVGMFYSIMKNTICSSIDWFYNEDEWKRRNDSIQSKYDRNSVTFSGKLTNFSW